MMLWRIVILTFSCLILSSNGKASLPSVNQFVDNGDGLEAESVNSYLTPKEDAISVPAARQATCINEATMPCKKVCNIVSRAICEHRNIFGPIDPTVMLKLIFYISS